MTSTICSRRLSIRPSSCILTICHPRRSSLLRPFARLRSMVRAWCATSRAWPARAPRRRRPRPSSTRRSWRQSRWPGRAGQACHCTGMVRSTCGSTWPMRPRWGASRSIPRSCARCCSICFSTPPTRCRKVGRSRSPRASAVNGIRPRWRSATRVRACLSPCVRAFSSHFSRPKVPKAAVWDWLWPTASSRAGVASSRWNHVLVKAPPSPFTCRTRPYRVPQSARTRRPKRRSALSPR